VSFQVQVVMIFPLLVISHFKMISMLIDLTTRSCFLLITNYLLEHNLLAVLRLTKLFQVSLYSS